MVGASTAGVLAALLLAREGHPVTLIDGSVEPAREVRTLIVTDRMVPLLSPRHVAQSVVATVESFELHSENEVARVRLSRPDLIVERSRLILDLLENGVAEGVKLVPGHRFEAFVGERAVRLTGPTGSVEVDAPIVIGADGASSTVAREVGVRHEHLSLIQAVVDRPGGLAPTTSRVWFRPERTPYFFWSIPDGPDKVAIGLIATRAAAARRLLDDFMEEEGLGRGTYQAARVPDYRRWIPLKRRWGGRDVYLIGDAGGHVKVSTVGGLVTGLRAARAAARMIASGGIDMGRATLRAELGCHALLRKALSGFDDAMYADLLQILSRSARRGIGGSSRDAAIPMVARALVRSPRLSLIGLRGLRAARS